MTMDGRQVTHYRSNEIWLNYGSEMTFFEMRCYTQCSGNLVDLQIRIHPVDPVPEPAKGSAWFVTNACYLLRFLATPSAEELRSLINRVERPPHRFSLSNGGVAEITRITARHSRKAEKETKEAAYRNCPWPAPECSMFGTDAPLAERWIADSWEPRKGYSRCMRFAPRAEATLAQAARRVRPFRCK